MDHTITGLLPVSCKNAPETEHQNAIIHRILGENA